MRKRWVCGFIPLLATFFVYSLSAHTQNNVPAFPRPGADKSLESDQFVIWKISLEKGKSTGMHQVSLDQVTVFLEDGAMKLTRADGTYLIEEEKRGSVRFEPKGEVIAEEWLSDKPGQAVTFQIKDDAVTPWTIPTGVQGQFPRVGTVKLFQAGRLIVWDETWGANELITAHMHDDRCANVFLAGGKLSEWSTNKSIAPRLISRVPGEVHIIDQVPFPHLEKAIEGTPRAIWVEVKNQ